MSLAHVVLNQFSPVAPVEFELSLRAAAEGTLHFGHSGDCEHTGGCAGLSKGELCVVLGSGEKFFYLLKTFSRAISFYFL